MNSSVLSSRLLKNPKFIKDLSVFLQSSLSLLVDLRSEIRISAQHTIHRDKIRRLASTHKVSEDYILEVASIFRFLLLRAIEFEVSTDDLYEEIKQVAVSTDGLKDISIGESLKQVFSYDNADRLAYQSNKAFGQPPTFVGSTLRPTLLKGLDDIDEFFRGYMWTISYLNSSGELCSTTFGLSETEATELLEDMRSSLVDFDSLSKRVPGEGGQVS